MATAGQILIELSIDDSGMPVVIKRAGLSLQEFKGTIDRTASSVKRLEDHHSSLATKLRHTITTLGSLRFALMDVNDVFFRLPLSILKSAGDLERMQVLMKGLSKETTDAGKAAEGIKNFKFVSDFSKTAPFDIAALSDSFVKLKTAGLDPADGSMKALVNSVAKFGGSSESLKRASVAIQQMSGKGVISMEELRQQLGEAVPTAMQDMADGMGVSMAELSKIVTTGTLATGPALGKMFNQMQINSQGAAAEMMKTWVGSLSLLKTEWQLAAKYMADAGFGDSAKDAVAKLTAALRTDEFKRFGNDAGVALGGAVNGVISTGQTLIKYRESIMLVVEAWLAYKVVTSGLIPLSAAIVSGYEKTTNLIKGEAQALTSAASATRQKLQSDAIEAANKQAKAARQQVQYTQELAALKAHNLQMAAEANSLNAAQKVKIKGFDNLDANIAKKAADVASLAALEKATLANAAAQSVLATKLAVTDIALQRQSVAALQAAIALNALSAKTALQTVAANAMTLATKLAGGAMALLGGPIGLAIIAITALAWWWGKAARDAEDSSDRQRRAIASVSSAQDAAKDKEEFAAAKDELANAAKNAVVKQVDDPTNPYGFRMKGTKDKEEDLARVKRASEKFNALQTRAGLSEVAVQEQVGRERIAGISIAVDRVIAARSTATQLEISRITQSQRDVLATLKVGSEEHTLKNNEFNKKKIQVELAGMDERIAAASGSAQYLRDLALKTTDQQLVASNLAAAKVQEANVDQMKMERDGFVAREKALVTFKDKKEPGGSGKTPIQTMIDSLLVDKARLEASLPGLMSALGKVDTVAVKMAELDAKLKTAALQKTVKGKDGKKVQVGPSDAEIELVKRVTRYNAELEVTSADLKTVSDKIAANGPDYQQAVAFLLNPVAPEDGPKANQFAELLAKLKGNPEILKSLSEKSGEAQSSILAKIKDGARQAAVIDYAAAYRPLIEQIVQTQPEFERALQMMADPLGSVDESKSNKFDKAIAKLRLVPGDLKSVTGEIILTSTQINRLMSELQAGKRQAATIDLANSYRALVAENEKMSLDIIENDRERTRIQLQNSDKVTTKREQNAIKDAKAAGVEIALVSQMQQQADIALILRAEELRLKTRTPLEKLTDEWKKSLNQMEDASASWANSFVDMVTSATTSGKLEFGSFVQSVLADILKVQLKSTLSGPLNTIIKAGTDKLQGYLPALGTNGPQSSASQAVGGAKAKAEFLAMEVATRKASDALLDTAQAAIGEVAEKIALSTTTATMTSAFGAASVSVQAFVAALNASKASTGGGGIADLAKSLLGGGTFTNDAGSLELLGSLGFANGGVMTSMGAMPLRKYAAGGIANSPQMAIFGEGAHNEAYVPLPDGRSIPVTMNGGSQASQVPNVTVNVINQSGTPVGAQQGQPRFDGKQMILDVVLTAANSPGGFRDGMKGAMR